MKALIKDSEDLTVMDSLLSNKEQEITIKDTIIEKQKSIIYLISDTLTLRTAQANLYMNKSNQKDAELKNQKTIIRNLYILAGLLAVLVIFK